MAFSFHFFFNIFFFPASTFWLFETCVSSLTRGLDHGSGGVGLFLGGWWVRTKSTSKGSQAVSSPTYPKMARTEQAELCQEHHHLDSGFGTVRPNGRVEATTHRSFTRGNRCSLLQVCCGSSWQSSVHGRSGGQEDDEFCQTEGFQKRSHEGNRGTFCATLLTYRQLEKAINE